jgi:hypothetical protein
VGGWIASNLLESEQEGVRVSHGSICQCTDGDICLVAAEMFALLLDANSYVNTINTWAEPHNANGVTPNSVIDSNDEPPCNNQQRMIQRGY